MKELELCKVRVNDLAEFFDALLATLLLDLAFARRDFGSTACARSPTSRALRRPRPKWALHCEPNALLADAGPARVLDTMPKR